MLILGWDAADWKVINPLLEQGKMPTLQKLIKEGVSGNVATLDPVLSPMLWTSIATGKYADKHGILGFTEPDPISGGVRPVTSTSRKCHAIWNILTQQGLKTHLIGWWPSHPAEPINGICVSNHFQRANQGIEKPWPVSAGMVSPKEFGRVLAPLRIHPDELTASHILPFIPHAFEINQDEDTRIAAMSRILADAATIQSTSTWIMETQDWDFIGVYFDAIDHFSHGFMKFHPPQLPGMPDDLFRYYKDVITGAYIFHDMMLEHILSLSGKNTTVILLSDHGFKSDHLRPISLPKEPAAPAHEHRQFGILCMKGPEIKTNERIFGATLLDITPTVLTTLNLPVGKDMDGVPLIQAFKSDVTIDEIESWELVEGNFGEYAEDFREDPFEAKQALDQLADLGYIDKEEDEDGEKSLLVAETERQFNLARVYLNSNRFHLVLPILRKLYDNNPEERFAVRIISCLRDMGKLKECGEFLNQIKKAKDNPALSFRILEVSLLIDEGKEMEALTKLDSLMEQSKSSPEIFIHAGRSYNALGKYSEAEKAFTQSLIFDPDRAISHFGMGLSFMGRKRYEDAVDAFLNAVGLVYQFPIAHLNLGESLYHLGEKKRALECFQVAMVMTPGMTKARKWIEKIQNENKIKESPEVLRNQVDISTLDQKLPKASTVNIKPFSRKIKGDIIVVSGLPRSGTSMIMQMLHEAGVEVLSDGKRSPDESNPKGYFEFEAVKGTARDKRWLNQAVDKAVKVIAQILVLLPPVYNYKVIFIKRDLSEVMNSQHTMLHHMGKNRKDTYNAGIRLSFEKALRRAEFWLQSKPNVETLYLDYKQTVENPGDAALEICRFLNLEYSRAELMATVVTKALYRNKVKDADQ